eukprot:INCI14285.1.p1 GENE.INCI14285.1~~INCI14285.1.p1  ORF type:complete len:243 (+),score=38.95 INCI14285.1:168-896(+)
MECVRELRMLQPAEDEHVDLELVFKKKAVFEKIAEIFPTHTGKQLSFEEREAANNHSTTLVYGEIKFEPFAIAVEKIRRKYGGLGKPGTGIYYDIGSGTGKPVFAAVLMHAFKRATGIEILSSLHNAALKTLEFWNENVVGGTKTEVTKAIDVPSSLVAPECAATKIEFINGDITKCETDISDATLLFANSTCFDDELMLAVVCNFCMICINIQDTSALWPAHEAMRPVHSCYYFLAAGRCC